MPALPDATTRLRCTACGNLTRFDVVRTVRSRDFLHADLAGAVEVAEREVLAETIEQVACRWCARPDAVVLEPRPLPG